MFHAKTICLGWILCLCIGGINVVSHADMDVKKEDWGKTADGQTVDLYTLTNDNGMVVKITNYGGIITELHVPDRDGNMGDVVLGFNTLEEYLAGHPFYGALVGRYCNRIAKGKFTIGDHTYELATNNGLNHLHGGKVGFDKVVWNAEKVALDIGVGVKLTYTSADGEEGYPGKVEVTATYILTNENELKLVFRATTTKPTHVNLTNHSYFNLAGHGSGDILDQKLMINADFFTPADDGLIPTGEIVKVEGTPLDFTKPTAIGERIDSDYEQIVIGNGYDHNFVLNEFDGTLHLAAKAVDPKSGRVMEVSTTQPGVQLYTSNGKGQRKGKGGKVYGQHGAFCLETQHFPDTPNVAHFPSTLLRPNEVYEHEIVYTFSAE